MADLIRYQLGIEKTGMPSGQDIFPFEPASSPTECHLHHLHISDQRAPLKALLTLSTSLTPFPVIMSEVMYYELGTKELQVVHRLYLFPFSNYEQVERPRTWGHQGTTAFKLIDIGGNKNFMSMPLSQKLEKTNKHLATLHWNGNIPPHLKGDRYFWVGPIDTCTDTLCFPRRSAPAD